MSFRWTWPAVLAVLTAVMATGCGPTEPPFRRYETYALKVERTIDDEFHFTEAQRRNVDDLLAAMFGTPNEPRLPQLPDMDLSSILDLTKLRMAAGPVGSDEAGRPSGLYREHCAHCHGISGDGAGPTASFLSPYPRDYRPGKYKFKSTPVGSKPTHEDLTKIVFDGVPGTAMPSFKLLPADELDALVHYVRYLSIRGETERQLLTLLADVDEGALLVDPKDPEATLPDITDLAAMVVQKWIEAPEQATEIPPRPTMTPEELVASQDRGRKLFYGTIANCVKCHGDSALGDGQTTDYDEWAKEFMQPNDPESVRPFVEVGLLEPHNIRPRNLRLGTYRGGNRPIDLYWRIRLGIEGTPMPASTMKPEDDPNAKGLTSDDIWDIVNYVQSLPYEPINNPIDHLPANIRERM